MHKCPETAEEAKRRAEANHLSPLRMSMYMRDLRKNGPKVKVEKKLHPYELRNIYQLKQSITEMDEIAKTTPMSMEDLFEIERMKNEVIRIRGSRTPIAVEKRTDDADKEIYVEVESTEKLFDPQAGLGSLVQADRYQGTGTGATIGTSFNVMDL